MTGNSKRDDMKPPSCKEAPCLPCADSCTQKSAGHSDKDDPAATVKPAHAINLCDAPSTAPFYDGAKIIFISDCVPFSEPDFHPRSLNRDVLFRGCFQKDAEDQIYHKLTALFFQNRIQSVDVFYMESPCCFRLVHLVCRALQESGKRIRLSLTKVAAEGSILEPRSSKNVKSRTGREKREEDLRKPSQTSE